MAVRSESVKTLGRTSAQHHKAKEATQRLRVIFLDDSERVFEVEVKFHSLWTCPLFLFAVLTLSLNTNILFLTIILSLCISIILIFVLFFSRNKCFLLLQTCHVPSVFFILSEIVPAVIFFFTILPLSVQTYIC